MKRGKFITFEGGEGAGKSTQAKRLAERLEHSGVAVSSRANREARRSAKTCANSFEGPSNGSSDGASALRRGARRARHIRHSARTRTRGPGSFRDRFIDSTRVYQGKLYGLEPELISVLERYTVAPDFPDLDVDPRSAGERRHRAGAESRHALAL